MAKTNTVLTHEGYQALVAELDDLRTNGRSQIAEKIAEARSFGDLSENAEYDEAMNEQAKLEARIAKLEEELKTATILDEDEMGTEEVRIGSKVTVFNHKKGINEEYTILSRSQADPKEKKISNESPIGHALMGKRVGDSVEVEVPSGAVLAFDILSIAKSK